MTEDEIKDARARYERFRDESIFTGAAMLRLLDAVDEERAICKRIAHERDIYFQQMTQAQADRGQSFIAALHHQAQTELLLELLGTLFPSSFERDVTMPDYAPQEWTLLITLPTGQVAFPWGDPEGLTAPILFDQGCVYDGHTLAEREQRIREFIRTGGRICAAEGCNMPVREVGRKFCSTTCYERQKKRNHRLRKRHVPETPRAPEEG